MSSIKVLDLFSGIGGFAHGFDMAGNFETVAFCEIDSHATKVLNKNFPNVPVIDDVRKIKGQDFKEVEVICGGFPCQDISVAGKQRGINEQTRSGLWIEYKRIIQEINPRWVVIENVRNLLSNGLAIVLQDLHEIGYDAEWEIISARSVGACHLRERAWIVAYPNSQYLRVKSERTEEGWNCLQQSEKAELGYNGEEEYTKSTDSNGKGLQRQLQGYGENGRMGKEKGGRCIDSSLREESSNKELSDSDYFRFWPTFTSEEEKCEWWAKATSSIRDWWEIESAICRVVDGLSNGLDKGRAQRIKQLGNSIVPQIARIIGSRILYHEALREL